MKTDWFIWRPGLEYGETEKDAIEYIATTGSVESVAEDFAEHSCGYSGDPFDEVVIRLREQAKGSPVYEVTVLAQVEVAFRAQNARVVSLDAARDEGAKP